MIESWSSYALGIATIPALAIVGFLIWLTVTAILIKSAPECSHCDWTHDETLVIISGRRLTLHIMREHPRASFVFLALYSSGIPHRIGRRIVRAQDSAGVRATPASWLVNAAALLPFGEPIVDAIFDVVRKKKGHEPGWFNDERKEWDAAIIQRHLSDPGSATNMRPIRHRAFLAGEAARKARLDVMTPEERKQAEAEDLDSAHWEEWLIRCRALHRTVPRTRG